MLAVLMAALLAAASVGTVSAHGQRPSRDGRAPRTDGAVQAAAFESERRIDRGRTPAVVASGSPAALAAIPREESTAGCPPLIESSLGPAGCMIAFCESGWDADATGPGGEMGWFQIHPRWHPDATHDPAGNVAAAVRISSGGTDWSAWTVRSVLTSGACPNGTAYPG